MTSSIHPRPYATPFRSGEADVRVLDLRVIRLVDVLRVDLGRTADAEDAVGALDDERRRVQLGREHGLEPRLVEGRVLLGRSEEHTSELQSLRQLVCRPS